MKNRPNAIIHMTLWGVIAGFILAIIYFNILFFIIFYNSREFYYPSLLFDIPLLEWIRTGVTFGLVPSLVVGFLNGLFHHRIVRTIAISSPKFDVLLKRNPIYLTSFILTTFLTIIVFSLFYYPYILAYALLTMPFSVIAGFIGLFASYHYLRRLQHWSESQYARKSKTKNEATYNLMEKAKTDDVYASEIDDLAQRSQQ